jgi:exopolyphosphatase/guanosine-5'-triphosphate,3'-diphosphate pyrophosphatase
MRLAAIDIGSNAARLLIVEVKLKRSRPEFNKLNLVRIPLRLGFDVFTNGTISPEKCSMILHMMRAFSALLDLYKVDAVKAYATSAMRNAINSDSIVNEIEQKTGLKIEIITGGKEADLLYQSHAAEKIDKNNTYLYANVGGGSTELTLIAKGKAQQELSFEIGTIRILKNAVKQSQWDECKRELKDMIRKNPPIAIIGTGGNINKIFSLSKLKDGKPLTYDAIQSYYRKLSLLTTAERIKKFKLSEDRADVIVPALDIYLSIMQWSKVNNMYVPKVGLVDGIINSLYHELVAERKK